MFIHGGTSGTIGSRFNVQRLTAGNLMANMIKVKVNQLEDRLALGGFTMAMANTKGETFEKRPLSPNLCVAFRF